jgi:hypothetical protein
MDNLYNIITPEPSAAKAQEQDGIIKKSGVLNSPIVFLLPTRFILSKDQIEKIIN